MGLTEHKSRIQEVYLKLEESLESIEETAFTTINQHDKILTLISSAEERVLENLSTLEMMGMELDHREALGTNVDVDMINDMLYKQTTLVEEIARTFQLMMDAHNELASKIHDMESEISSHRDSVDMVKDLLEDIHYESL